MEWAYGIVYPYALVINLKKDLSENVF